MNEEESHVIWVHQAAFIGGLCLAIPSLRPLLKENTHGRRREILPDSFMFEVSKWVVAKVQKNGLDDPEVRKVLDFCESQYGSDEWAIDNLIAVSFAEMFLSDREVGWAIIGSFGPNLTHAVRSVMPKSDKPWRNPLQHGKTLWRPEQKPNKSGREPTKARKKKLSSPGLTRRSTERPGSVTVSCAAGATLILRGAAARWIAGSSSAMTTESWTGCALYSALTLFHSGLKPIR